MRNGDLNADTQNQLVTSGNRTVIERDFRIETSDVLLAAAANGWGTTIRYSILVLVRRGSIGAGIMMLFEIAHRAGWV